MNAGYVAAIVLVFGLVIAGVLAWPTCEELERFEKVEKSLEPSTFLELGVVLVVMVAVCAAVAAFKFALGVP